MRSAVQTALALITVGTLSVGCGTQGSVDDTQEIMANLAQAGFPKSEIQVVDGAVFVGRDAHVTLEASREMIEVASGSTKEQFRTVNLVSAAITKICINPTASFNAYANLSQGLNLAIENYNQLGLRFVLARGPASGCNANITITTTSGIGGSSGFPTGGLPYRQINIGTGLQSLSLDVNEHVITHEIGHAIGLRHSDFYNRSISCGTGGSEGTGGEGAILIPGTPSTATVGGSVMNSCFRATETGEFTASDRTALTTLY